MHNDMKEILINLDHNNLYLQVNVLEMYKTTFAILYKHHFQHYVTVLELKK